MGLEKEIVLMSIALSEEIADVMSRARFDKYVSSEERALFLAALLDASEVVEIVDSIRICRDPKDDKILELAISGNADCIVTGDDDLLALNPFRGVAIVTPADFLQASSH
ncbi:MAG: putative toxin-antitoxin system toxin component, PIN family [Caldilineaceae bacterium]|nr:putative toxin-antitoxin system toxin component, PIN family [Caldilineaceae bacterium]